MKKIFKYQLKVVGVQMVKMPKGAAVLTVQTQHNNPCIWAEVDPDAPIVKRRFIMYGTGHPMLSEEVTHYVGTYQLPQSGLVFHVYTNRKEYTE